MARKLAVLVTGAVLLVAACTTETRTTNETSSNAPEGSAASYASAPCPNPIYGAGLDLGPEFTCGYLTVPENRTKSDSRTIRLAVATRKATAPSPKPDPILFLTGGPGGSGLAEGPGVAKQWPPDRDVIFLDQRGALKSEPFLSCPEVDTFMEHTVELSWSAPATAEQGAAATRTCRDRLAAAGADLAAYNTTPPKTRPMWPISAPRSGSTSGTSTGSPTDPTWPCRPCAITPPGSAASSSTLFSPQREPDRDRLAGRKRECHRHLRRLRGRPGMPHRLRRGPR